MGELGCHAKTIVPLLCGAIEMTCKALCSREPNDKELLKETKRLIFVNFYCFRP